MKMNKKTLATVVMGALLTPIFGGGSSRGCKSLYDI